MGQRAGIVPARAALALITIVAGVFPAWAPLNVPRLDDRSFRDLARAIESLGTGLGATSPPAAPARQTPKTDFGPIVKEGVAGSACCDEQIQQVRAALERVRADRKRYAAAARGGGRENVLKQIERLDGELRAFEKALRDVERAKSEEAASRRFTALSNIMKSMHDTAKAIVQNMKA